jgi:hypothetical protein
MSKFNPLYWLDKFESLETDSLVSKVFLTSIFLGLVLLCTIIVANKL